MKKFWILTISLIIACGSPEKDATQDEEESTETAESTSEENEPVESSSTTELQQSPPMSADDAGIPFPPNSKYVPSSTGSGATLMIFISKDSPEDIINFYSDKLNDWSFDDELQTFWNGPSDPRPGYAEMLTKYKSVVVAEYGMDGYNSSINITVPEE